MPISASETPKSPRFTGRELADLLRSLPRPDEQYLVLIENLIAKQPVMANSKWTR
jgi:hypothetical protein